MRRCTLAQGIQSDSAEVVLGRGGTSATPWQRGVTRRGTWDGEAYGVRVDTRGGVAGTGRAAAKHEEPRQIWSQKRDVESELNRDTPWSAAPRCIGATQCYRYGRDVDRNRSEGDSESPVHGSQQHKMTFGFRVIAAIVVLADVESESRVSYMHGISWDLDVAEAGIVIYESVQAAGLNESAKHRGRFVDARSLGPSMPVMANMAIVIPTSCSKPSRRWRFAGTARVDDGQ
ncbi:hypothetical protein DFH09DRAFT_1277458 [Mycena vulgaris]|nr:hypothetical protein DFH09DRAFT_1277458 [Mycena vulgaris]